MATRHALYYTQGWVVTHTHTHIHTHVQLGGVGGMYSLPLSHPGSSPRDIQEQWAASDAAMQQCFTFNRKAREQAPTCCTMRDLNPRPSCCEAAVLRTVPPCPGPFCVEFACSPRVHPGSPRRTPTIKTCKKSRCSSVLTLTKSGPSTWTWSPGAASLAAHCSWMSLGEDFPGWEKKQRTPSTIVSPACACVCVCVCAVCVAIKRACPPDFISTSPDMLHHAGLEPTTLCATHWATVPPSVEVSLSKTPPNPTCSP